MHQECFSHHCTWVTHRPEGKEIAHGMLIAITVAERCRLWQSNKLSINCTSTTWHLELCILGLSLGAWLLGHSNEGGDTYVRGRLCQAEHVKRLPSTGGVPSISGSCGFLPTLWLEKTHDMKSTLNEFLSVQYSTVNCMNVAVHHVSNFFILPDDLNKVRSCIAYDSVFFFF